MMVGPVERLIVVLSVLIVFTTPVAGASLPADSTTPPGDSIPKERGIVGVTYNGSGIAAVENNLTYVWQDGSTRLRATIQSFQGIRTHRICLNATTAGENASNTSEPIRQYGCKQKEIGTVGARVTFNLKRLDINETGRYELVITVSGGDRVDTTSVPIYVIYRDDDLDDDGLTNAEEVSRGTNLNGTDTDSDGLQDGPEVHTYGTDPTEADTDGDGLRDAVEIQRGTDPTVADFDDDGLEDGPEVNEYGTDPTDPDTDDDGFTDGEEIRKHGTDPLDPDDRPGGKNKSSDDPWNVLVDPMAWGVLGVLLMLLSLVGFVAYRRTPEGMTDSDDEGGGSRDEPPATDVLSPEEHVHQLLQEHDGKIRQSEIVDLTDWSKAKVSRILSRMEDDDEIKRTRIGRGNVVSHPDTAPEDAER